MLPSARRSFNKDCLTLSRKSLVNIKSVRIIKKALLSICVFITIIFAYSLLNSPAYPQNLFKANPSLHLSQTLSDRSPVREVRSVGMTVADMDRAVEFYSQVLSFQKISEVEVWGTEYEKLQGLFGVRMRVVRMKLGDEAIELTDYLTPGGRPIPIDARSNDRAFQHIAIVVSDMARAYQKLSEHKVQYVSTAPQRLPEYIKVAAGIEAFYFRDPDGHNLEIIHYPADKGDPKWQKPTEKLFLGIDHTAIAVSNTANSLRFYRDLLGLQLKGESINYGTEQEHLNNVFGARLHISGLRTVKGIGIEFLEYLQPRNGRSIPSDTRSDDLAHWETMLVVDDANAAAQKLRASGYIFVSSGVIEMPKQTLGFRKGFLVRDPDGHAIAIVEN
jgi:catechol 2,3-dioxygenase-like lactoylglutathione lyase family enzyme